MQYYKNATRYTIILFVFIIFLIIYSLFVKNTMSNTINADKQYEMIMRQQVEEEKERLQSEYDKAYDKKIEEINRAQQNFIELQKQYQQNPDYTSEPQRQYRDGSDSDYVNEPAPEYQGSEQIPEENNS